MKNFYKIGWGSNLCLYSLIDRQSSTMKGGASK